MHESCIVGSWIVGSCIVNSHNPFRAHLVLLTDKPNLALHSTTWSKPSCASCVSSWLTGLTLGKYACNNMQLHRCKPTNAPTITSANYLYLNMEQLFRTHWQFTWKNLKIMSMEKWRFWVLTCKILIHNEVFHNKLLLNTYAFLFNFCFHYQSSHFRAYILHVS